MDETAPPAGSCPVSLESVDTRDTWFERASFSYSGARGDARPARVATRWPRACSATLCSRASCSAEGGAASRARRHGILAKAAAAAVATLLSGREHDGRQHSGRNYSLARCAAFPPTAALRWSQCVRQSRNDAHELAWEASGAAEPHLYGKHCHLTGAALVGIA